VRRSALLLAAAALVMCAAGGVSGCATTGRQAAAGGPVRVVAIEGFWGSLAAQIGGSRARVTSVITSPDVDPHEYEATVADARDLATARLVVINGIGYDGWARRLVDANPERGRVVLDVGELVGVRPGGNPHRWYSPPDVRRVIDRLTDDLRRLDPAGASYYATRRQDLLDVGLGRYFGLIEQIRNGYRGTVVGASESIFVPLADALGLTVLTPRSFLDAMSEGADPTAADKVTIDRQIRTRQIKVYVYNGQNLTPDVNAQVAAARAAGIPVVTITETPSPPGASFQDWQVRQLAALAAALAKASGA
jgi:zinc/manganese transport system substrate-binding protein